MPWKITNTHQINPLFIRARHRLVARRMKTDPRVLERARAVVRGWRAHGQPGEVLPIFVQEWESILEQPPEEIRRIITRPGEHMDRLRSSSPFGGIGIIQMSVDDRRRLWRKFARFRI